MVGHLVDRVVEEDQQLPHVRRDRDAIAQLEVTERPHPEVIPRCKQAPPPFIPGRECEIADEAGGGLVAPFQIGLACELEIRAVVERGVRLAQIPDELGPVVQAHVTGEQQPLILIPGRSGAPVSGDDGPGRQARRRSRRTDDDLSVRRTSGIRVHQRTRQLETALALVRSRCERKNEHRG